MISNLRLVPDVKVQAGDQSHSNYSLPGLVGLLNRLASNSRPEFVRGDIGWGTDGVMSELEEINQRYLFKLRKANNVRNLIYKHHCLGEWSYINKQWEAKEDVLCLQGWKNERWVNIVRRRLSNEYTLGTE
jgi:hypothetical protein